MIARRLPTAFAALALSVLLSAPLRDPSGDGRNAWYFQINAEGAQADGLVSGPEEASPDWDGVWEAKARIGPSGWTGELRIPAATLRFPEGRDAWRFNVDRFVARERLHLRWSGTTLDAKLPDVSRAGTLTGVAGLKRGLGFELRPFALHPGPEGGPPHPDVLQSPRPRPRPQRCRTAA